MWFLDNLISQKLRWLRKKGLPNIKYVKNNHGDMDIATLHVLSNIVLILKPLGVLLYTCGYCNIFCWMFRFCHCCSSNKNIFTQVAKLFVVVWSASPHNMESVPNVARRTVQNKHISRKQTVPQASVLSSSPCTRNMRKTLQFRLEFRFFFSISEFNGLNSWFVWNIANV